MSIAKKALVGALWASGANYLSQSVGFISLAILGRLLLEEHFGLFATANAIVQIVFILSALSFNLSIIQSAEERPALYSTAFALNLGLCAVSLLITGLAIFGYSLFRDLSTLEIAVIMALSVANILNLFGQLFDAILQRNLEFKKTATISFFMNLANPVVAVTLAFLGAGVWAMVAGQIAAGLIFMIGSYYFAGWRVNLNFSRETAKWFLGLGWKFMGSRSLEVLYTELDRLVIKSMNSYEQVGIYDRAVMAARYPAKVVTPTVINVALPVYSKVKIQTDRLSDAFTLVNFFLIRILLPFGLIFFLLPDYFMVGILGSKWISSAPVLKILALYAVLHPVVENLRVLFYSLGKPGEVAKVRVVQILVYIPSLIGLTAEFGIIGAAYALVFSIVVTWVFFIIKARKEISYPLIKTIALPILISLVIVALYQFLPVLHFDSMFIGLCVQSMIIATSFLILELLMERKAVFQHIHYFRTILKNSDTTGEGSDTIDGKSTADGIEDSQNHGDGQTDDNESEESEE